jgi:glycosyltransferase involved in cell wall biosynthesis
MTDNAAFLSIIIAAHNSEKTLPETLQNLLDACAYNFTGIEIILIDDSSSDCTEEIVHTFSENHTQVHPFKVNYRNIGQVRQFGIDHSTGDYIMMLDSDDLMMHGSLPRIIDFLAQRRPDILLTKLIEVREKSSIDYIWHDQQPKKISQDEAITLFLIHKDVQAHLIGQFIKREYYLENIIPSMTCYEDFYIFPKILSCSQKIYFLRKGFYFYIKRSGSLSSTPDRQKLTNLIVCTEKMTTLFEQKFQQLVLCHWLDIYLKHTMFLYNTNEKEIVRRYVRKTWSIGFLLASDVRLSYKRKSIHLLYKNIKKSL